MSVLSGRRAITSVKVPPRSIQKSQLPCAFTASLSLSNSTAFDTEFRHCEVRRTEAIQFLVLDCFALRFAAGSQ
jgi:hypothetical protein